MSVADIRLRAMEPEDLDFLYTMENDSDLWNVSNTSVPYSRYVLHDYIANSTNDIYNDGQVRMIIEGEDGTLMGMADLFNFNAQHCRAEVSIVVRRDCRRSGVGQAALRKVACYALRTLHLHQLYAVIAADNVASLALFRKEGFKPSGLLREWLYDGRKYKDAVVLNKIL